MKSTQQPTISNVNALMAQGSGFYKQESFNRAIEIYKQALMMLEAIKKTKSTTPEIIEEYQAKIHYQIALNYYDFGYSGGNLEEGEKHCQQILELKYKGNIINVYELLGKICVKQKKFKEALKFYDEIMAVIPDKESVDAVHAYNLKADIYLERAKLNQERDEREKEIVLADKTYEKAMGIATKLKIDEGTIEAVHYWRAIGEINQLRCYHKGVASCYSKAVKILKTIAPNSSDLADCIRKVGFAYYQQRKYQESLAAYLEAIEILKDKPHPIILSYPRFFVAENAIELKQYDVALKQAEAIMDNPRNKYFHFGYYIKARIIKEQALDEAVTPDLRDRKRKLESSLPLFDQAMKPGIYPDDFRLQRIWTQVTLAEVTKALGEEIDSKAIVADIKPLLSPRSKSSPTQNGEMRLTNAEYQAKLDQALQRLEHMGIKLGALEEESRDHAVKIATVQTTLNNHEARLATIEAELPQIQAKLQLLEGHIYDMQVIQDTTRQSIGSLNKRLKKAEAENNNDLIQALKQARAEELGIQRKENIINSNSDLREYYSALLSELTGGHAAAKALQLNQISMTSSGTSIGEKTKAALISSAASYAANLASLIPVVGKAASMVFAGIGNVATIYQKAHDINNLVRFAENVAVSPDDFYKIAKILAIELTLAKQEELKKLHGTKVENATIESFKAALKQGSQAGMRYFIDRKDKTKARLLGLTDAYVVMSSLQERELGDKLRVNKQPEGQSKHLATANKIIELLPDELTKKPTHDEPLIANPQPRMKPQSADRAGKDRRCIIL